MGAPCYHLGFGREDLGEHPPVLALICGDPARADRLAGDRRWVEHRSLAAHRGLHSHLCRLPDGRPVLVGTHGMGAPSLSIVVNELISLGIRQIIRMGTCGAIQEHIHAGDLVISSGALCRQGAALDIAPRDYPAVADPFFTTALYRAALSLELPVHLGITASVDTFFEGQERSEVPHLLRRLRGITAEYRDLRLLSYEMECGTLFKMGGVYGFAAACICAVIAERMSGDEVFRQTITGAEDRAMDVVFRMLTDTTWAGGGD